MKTALLVLLASLALPAALLWLLASHANLGVDLPAPGQYVCRLAAARGTFSLTIFTTIPEDDFYRSLQIPAWLPASTLLALTALLSLPTRRRRHPHAAFPVEPPPTHPS